ncbi:phospholipid/cholesterol/gamma-HCH transport system substrate-binding protein [Actinomadura pelletieri DSM 43383]|uniref:Phospholipid/cholesterol/gamma-HCH transport system substrate-binding protein n=1 Tax=Actinomadura pelletieri DSM 43383 TaxID=1120940 RepID=A0A495QRG9_9ACTN|nr:MCE family protein [Actinomadura pelletieri]RKS76067.1 phospholipid/cholesterol/gamma-HCH transport system substrate-binding protein [Actinomadura pelletieri DSM 43383]
MSRRGTTSAAIKLAIFVVATSVATGVLAMTIGNLRFRSTVEYKAIFTDVTGLLANDDVRAAGVRVGQVEDVRLYRGTQAEVTFSVEDDGVFRNGLPSSTKAQIRYRNLMGQRYLALTDGAGPANRYLDPGDTIPVSRTAPALDLTTLFNGFRPLFRALEPKDVNTLAMQIVQVLQGEGGTVNSLLAHVASLTGTLADRDRVIGQVIDNLNAVLGTIDRRHAEVDRLIRDLRGFVGGVSADREAIFDSVAAINDLTGTTRDLLAEGRPDIRNDIAGLRKLMGTLDANKRDLDQGLQRTPNRLQELVNISSYGSWFNMYICGFDARVRLPGGPVYETPAIVNENARCK